ncbi:3-deoxy-7-phosphoheptulonate synthase [Haloplasma contractile]|uniref:3-deoxy-D-arabino-heptulosonate 7-phosphate synthase protein n=1 Tax=Haloplasma contractile SSD-17B TaxID=1033810 RepID=U2E9Y5_9MOLU|nr:3-deoxy-7-phosphoheptulonate synthase [Haloplasma contractile]ERJ11656.1 3-deoxy-D-arabino-heptulosonate 7-phosphate synthase protein [Haloplasma contractile SSD-17B]
MVVVMKASSTNEQIEKVINKLRSFDLDIHLSQGTTRTIIGGVGDPKEKEMIMETIEVMDGVEKVVAIVNPYKLASREFKQEDTVIKIGDLCIGGNEIIVMAGPCAVENEQQIIETAEAVKRAGAKILRGGAFKPRTSPYSFQGLGEDGLKLLAKAREKTGLKIVTELMDLQHIKIVNEYSDIIQIGARNMQNFTLLKAVGKLQKPVLLKRGMSATVKELLMAAEYIMSEGNHQVILCERGIRTFEDATRNTLDLSIVPVIKEISHLPIIIDPSHATGKWNLVKPMTKAAIASGADGLIIEVHPNPLDAVSDGPQSLKFNNFNDLMNESRLVANAIGRNIAGDSDDVS